MMADDKKTVTLTKDRIVRLLLEGFLHYRERNGSLSMLNMEFVADQVLEGEFDYSYDPERLDGGY